MKSPTVKEVAQQARVSVATVSRVLNGSTAVDDELRQRVMSAVEKLDYRPNRLARSLRTKSTKTIAIVVPDIQNPFFVSVERGLEEVAFKEGYTVLVCNTDDDPDREATYLQVLTDEAVAGIVVCATDERRSSTQILKVLEQGIAMVALDRRLENAPIDGVLSDNFGGSRTAVTHLIEQGHTRIGLIAGPAKYAPARERRMGYEQAHIDAGLSVDPDLIKITNFKSPGAEAATEELLGMDNRPTALFLSSGNVSIGSLRAIHRLGCSIPNDVSLIVFDDLDWASSYNPPLTVIAQNTRALGGLAGDLLLRRIKGSEEPPQERHLPTQISHSGFRKQKGLKAKSNIATVVRIQVSRRKHMLRRIALLLLLVILLAACGGSEGYSAVTVDNASSVTRVTILSSSTGSINAVAWSADGKMLASAGDDHTIYLWDTSANKEIRHWSAHTLAVAALAFSPDGKMLASGGRDKALFVWDPATGTQLHTVTDTDQVLAVAFSPDGKTLAYGGRSKKLTLADPATLNPIKPSTALATASTAFPSRPTAKPSLPPARIARCKPGMSPAAPKAWR